MNKKNMRIITDILMYAAMCFLAGTGLLLEYRLISGCEGGHGLTLLGFSRHEWGTAHLWSAYLLLALIVVHLVLNFAFIRSVIARDSIWLMLALALGGILITLFFLVMPIKRTGEDKGHGRFRKQKLEAGQGKQQLQER
ncbi:MAG: DUF4405 domain-containing protein [Kiritimatiellae bacterium]|nr:DUF4405 domain-containing protein [Kiritimatiellia bacterium]